MDPRRPVDLCVTVAAGVTRDVNRNLNSAAELRIKYRPHTLGLDWAGLALNTLWAAAATAYGSTSLMAGLLAPLTPTGLSSSSSPSLQKSSP